MNLRREGWKIVPPNEVGTKVLCLVELGVKGEAVCQTSDVRCGLTINVSWSAHEAEFPSASPTLHCSRFRSFRV